MDSPLIISFEQVLHFKLELAHCNSVGVVEAIRRIISFDYDLTYPAWVEKLWR
jgi:hypothetical protein